MAFGLPWATRYPFQEGKHRRNTFVWDKCYSGNSPTGIIYGRQEAAFWRSVFKPVFIRAIKLLKLTVSVSSLAPGAVDDFVSGFGLPESLTDHELPNGFCVPMHVVVLCQLLRGKTWSKIRVMDF